ncbi:unnamed protein product [Cuscuta epithymum]|uniref:RNase H type-1 domain-containing protein n=1 Tax=Cuscuta epithymum TaxID=186058 RepID=A0AAV0CQK8_9ASTE|nr:unnamed protein product [Cuscuta epithymum]
MGKAETMVGGWIQAQTDRKSKLMGRKQPAACWSRPISGRVKLNVDAAIAAVRDSGCGLGWCLRDDRGFFCCRSSSAMDGDALTFDGGIGWHKGSIKLAAGLRVEGDRCGV